MAMVQLMRLSSNFETCLQDSERLEPSVGGVVEVGVKEQVAEIRPTRRSDSCFAEDVLSRRSLFILLFLPTSPPFSF